MRIRFGVATFVATFFAIGLFLGSTCARAEDSGAANTSRASPLPQEPQASPPEKIAIATFAGGCFWCMEPAFDVVPGVISTTSGYTGGTKVDPTYEEVSAGHTGHAESVQVRYDPSRVTYQALLDVFWHNIDPVAVERQFCDAGHQYRSAIFYRDDEQRAFAEASKHALETSGRFKQPIATTIEPAGPFFKAEEYHQDYYKKNPIRYKFYRYNCGRDQRLSEIWGDEAPKH